MSVRKTIKWLLLIVVAIGMAGGGYAYWMWTNANALLLEHLRATIAERAPGWHVEIESAKFDWNRRIHVYKLTLRDQSGSGTIVHVPEAVLAVDREKLAESQIVDVQRIRLIRPEVHLVRDSQGRWNWQKLPPLKESQERSPFPEVVVEDATVHVRLEQAEGRESAEFQLRQLAAKLVPQGARQFVVAGSTTVRDAGKLTASGRWNVDAKTWSFEGRMQDVRANGELLALAVGTSPELRANVARLEATLRKFTPPAERPKAPVDADALPNLGVTAVVDVNFHLAREASQKELQFDLRASVRNGRINNPALPVELHELQADVHWTNDRIEIRDIAASSGTLRFLADAEVRRVGKATPARIRLKVVNLPLDARLQRRLPANWRKIYDTIRPAGRVDVAGVLDYDGQSWKPHGLVLTTKDCSFSHVEYPYRFTAVNGSVTQRDDDRSLFDFDFNGRAGRQPARLTGRVHNPGPKATSRFDLAITGLLLDDNLLAACPPAARKALKSMHATGRVNAWLTTTERAGIDKSPRIQITADMQNCAVNYEDFPYRLDTLTGRMTYDSQTEVWKFSNLRAKNGPATYTGSGFLAQENGKTVLGLKAVGTRASFDKALYRAVPKSLQRLWDDLSPTGRVDLAIDLNWREGEPIEISIPVCTVTNGTMLVKSFPYAFEKITAKFAYEKPRLRILSFTAQHDDTRIRAEGFAETHPNGDWRLRLVKFYADDLVPDRVFRKALSPGLREVFEEFNPRGKVSMSGMLEFKGTDREQDPVTAAWELKSIFAGNSLKMGVELKNVYGRAFAKGTWDGKIIDMRHKGNRIDLSSFYVHGYQFTRVKGPFRLYDKSLVVGSGEFFKRRRRGEKTPKVDLKDRMTAEAVGGQFTLDAVASFDKEVRYNILLTMEKARLETFAKRYLKENRNMRGVMYARVKLAGKGQTTKNLVGQGKFLLSPAALYELPVLVQTFKALTFVPPDKTAFKRAYAEFEIKDLQFKFKTIDLRGDAINLLGRGVARFDGKLALDFYSMLPRSRLPGFILQNLVATATSGWVGVDVRGTVKRPVARVRAIPQIDDALQRFLRSFGTAPTRMQPAYPPRGSRPQRRRMTGPPRR